MRTSRTLTCLGLALLLTWPATQAGEGPQYLDPDAATGSAKAVVVDPGPLVHTAQLLPVDGKGAVVGKGQPARQVERVLDDLASLLKETGSRLDRTVKLNFCVAGPEVAAEVHKALARRFPGRAKPAVSLVAGALPHPEALVAVDAVAIAAGPSPAAVKRLGMARAAVLPTGAHVYVSGQAERGELLEATRKTLQSLRATLTFLGLKDEHVVQVKAFLQPMPSVEQVRKEVAAFFGKESPPLVFVEWKSPLPIEIELIAWDGKKRAGEAVEYLTPPGMKASPVFSRVTRVNRGRLVYVSGLFGTTTANPTAEITEIFGTLGRVLDRADSDLRHLVKATYYVTTADAVRKMGELRPKYYDPSRPPAASLALVPGVGKAGRTVTLDMIAVVPPDRPLNEYGPPEHGHGLTAREAAEGWISLFDGKTTFGWGQGRVEDGLLHAAATTSTELGRCELKAEFARGGAFGVGGKGYKVGPGPFHLAETGGRGPITLGEGATVRKLLVRPLELKPLFNGKDLSGWKRIDHPRLPKERQATWKIEGGALRAVGGPGALEYEGKLYGNVVLQVEVKTHARFANGGLFFRSIPGQFLNGYEAQIHNRCEGRDPGKPSLWATGGIDDRQNARRLVSRDGVPFVMTVIAHGPHLATWVNGHQVSDWTDTRPRHENPRQGLRTEAGAVQLQAHDPQTDLEFRAIRAAEWK
ncbi:MAG: DUF1080 domain-containing protein [Gemmataceae bacterium]|nr:DUF1080 domain-containing protein [Gemmataceae bacterium]